MPACIVNGCTPKSRAGEAAVVLHNFPKDKDRIRTWLLATGLIFTNIEEYIDKIYDTYSSSVRICSKHFAPDAYMTNPATGKKRLSPVAVPTIFPPKDIGDQNEQGRCAYPSRKRKRLLKEGVSTSKLLPGEICPTCNNMIPQVPSSQSVQGPSMVDRETTFDRFWATETVGYQCSSLMEPIKQPAPKKRSGPPLTSGLIKFPRLYECTEEEPVDKTPQKFQQVQQPIPEMDQAVLCTGNSSIKTEYDPKYPTFIVTPSQISSNSENEDANNSDAVLEEGEILSDYNPEYQKHFRNHPSEDLKFLVYESCLDELITKIPCPAYGHCSKTINRIVKKSLGSYIAVYVQCEDKHYRRLWQSQPRVQKETLGNMQLATAIVTSGNTFVKVNQFFKICNILGISESTFSRIQHKYIFPAIDRVWRLNQNEELSKLTDKAICVAGDGQSDSPGHNAKYCVYTLMDVETKKILNFNIQQIGTGVSSVDLEKLACKEALDSLIAKNVYIAMFCTDRHVSIRKMIREEYRDIEYQFDIWHLAKSVGKKILAASKKKNCQDLTEWIGPIKNHMWWSANTCNENPDQLIIRWKSLLYHVRNIHSWEHYDPVFNCCQHNQLTDKKIKKTKWLKQESASFVALSKIVMDSRLLRDLRKINYFCHTGELEVFHSSLSKYRPKRLHFTNDEMHARTQLAVLDHNHNVHQLQAVLREQTGSSHELGTPRYKGAYSKAQKDWLLQILHETTKQEYISNIMTDVVELAAGNLSTDWSSRRSELPFKYSWKNQISN